MANWFADVGQIRRYEIPEINGWIECRQELSVGEQRQMFADAIKGQVTLEDGKIRTEYDGKKLAFGQVLAYLAAWSEKQEPTATSIQALKPEIYRHIEGAVQKHVEALEKKESGQTAPIQPTLSVVPTSPSAA